MTTYVVTDYDGCNYITAGKRYEVIRKVDRGFRFCNDDGDNVFSFWAESSHIGKGDWTVIEEPDTPKTWGEMTDAEKGALLLHEYQNGDKSIQFNLPEYTDDKSWGTKMRHETFEDDWAYRAKPEPVVGELVLLGANYGDGDYCFDFTENDDDTHTLTLPTLDGQLVTGEFTNEDGIKVVIEEKQK